MLTTVADDWLIYFTKEAKPPARGLFKPEPNKPSTTNMPLSNCGGSNSSVTSVKAFMALQSDAFCRFALQSSDKFPLMLNK